jgi:hypothetical protein
MAFFQECRDECHVGEEGTEARPVNAWFGPSNLNAVCPYFTMFPLDFPLSVLDGKAQRGDWVLDPFCGRGTTNFAARMLDLNTIGIDSSPVAAAITSAKLATTTPAAVVAAAKRILDQEHPIDMPSGEFWEWAYHPDSLQDLCRLRAALLAGCRSDARRVLRAVVMGALHGPRSKGQPSYFSNQNPRTYAPKPAYAVRFWAKHQMIPPKVDTLALIERRAQRALAVQLPVVQGFVRKSDSRTKASWRGIERKFRWVVTSPPYYGMVTYVADQWLRAWFVGGPPVVDYRRSDQLSHRSANDFCADLAQVWTNVAEVCLPDVTMVVRFGAINDRPIAATEAATQSLRQADWIVERVIAAGTASCGRRQANHFTASRRPALSEVDIYARLP